MAWLEIHTVLSRHRKLKELGITLGIKSVYAKSHVLSIWLTALEQQEDGDLRKWSDPFLAEAAEFEGDPVLFRKALEDKGWLDKGLIHDWLDYAGRYLMNKYASSNVGRLREIWTIHGRRYGKATETQPKRNRNKTTPNLTIPNHTNQTIPVGAFEIVWAKYPLRLGRKKAELHFKASVKTPLDWLDINNALDNYISKIRRDQTAPEYTLHGKTWFNNWRDYIDYKGVVLPPKPKAPAKPPEVLPPDPTAAEIKEMHRDYTRQLGPCKDLQCDICHPKNSEAPK